MKRFFLALVLAFAMFVPIAAEPVQADSIVQVHIYDFTTGWDEVTARPATLLEGHYYFITAEAPAHAGQVDLDLGLTAFSPYFTYMGSGCGFGGNGSGSGSLYQTKRSCVAGSGGTAAYASITVEAINQLTVAYMIGRARTPTGLDTVQYSIN